MAVDIQKEYNRLRALEDKLLLSVKPTGGYVYPRNSKELKDVQAKLKALKPKLTESPGVVGTRLPQRTAAQIAESLDYSTDPNSDFQKALKNVKSEADAKAIEDAKKKQIADLEAGYISEKKAQEKQVSLAKKASEDARKATEDATQLEKENAVRLAMGQSPLATKNGAVVPAGTWVQPTQDVSWVEKQFTDGRGANVNAVYMGTKPVRSTSRTAGGVGVGAKTVLAQEATDMFVKDPKLQAKVIQSMKNAGMDNVNQLTAYMQWQSYVEQARVAYKGGQGLLVTPMDVLNMSLKESSATKTTTQRYASEFKPDIIGNLIDSIFQNTLGMNPTQAQRTKYLSEFKALSDKGSVTTTTSSGGNSSSVTKGGFSQEDMAAKLTKNLKTSPGFSTDLQERQALDFNSAIDKLMSRGM